jgi:predicted transposase YbfD/YdcC
MLDVLPKARLRTLLEHFSVIGDPRQSWKVMYPLREVILLMVCATIAARDDYDEIALWGETHLDFLRTLSEFHFGVPCEDWLRDLMNRIEPKLFRACFEAWVAERWPEAPRLVALDGKTSRGSRDEAGGRKALHLISAFATDRHLVLGQEAVSEKSNEITAIPLLLKRLALEEAIVTIDAMGCNPAIAQNILDAKADYLLAVKDNQPTLHAEIDSYFETAPSDEVEVVEDVDKGHGRLEFRTCRLSHAIDWLEPTAPSPAPTASPRPPPSPSSTPGSSTRARSPSPGDPTSSPGQYRLRPSPRPCVRTGASRTNCTGCSMSPSMKTPHAYTGVISAVAAATAVVIRALSPALVGYLKGQAGRKIQIEYRGAKLKIDGASPEEIDRALELFEQQITAQQCQIETKAEKSPRKKPSPKQ